eukprot:TRINITY_DN38548_c0_g1_i1.p1 TRINITY_DN38548_c0_g1~~TRINITY_DN38548_c0_g1_i1.p1  ORF type:complete len:334 (-),score=74.86 TRINITY_DN38548_c0_g1_i1:724-1725(-)
MSAAVLGKRSLFDDNYGSPPSSIKRARCGSGSPIRGISPSSSSPSLLRGGAGLLSTGSYPPTSEVTREQLVALQRLFPGMDDNLLQKVLESCGNNIDAAIQSLNSLRLSSNDPAQPQHEQEGAASQAGSEADPLISNGPQQQASPPQGANHVAAAGADESSLGQASGTPGDSQPGTAGSSAAGTLPAISPETMSGNDWVEMVIRELAAATDMDNARLRVAHMLEVFEKVVRTGGGGENAAALEQLGKEKALLKEMVQKLTSDNTILKKAVTIQHARQVEHEERGREMAQLKQMLHQYQEQLRALELRNYALNMHLKTAEQASSIPSRFHPDIF